MSDRRATERPESPDRRDFPRPPLWLNLLLLVLAAATFAYARHQHDQVEQKTAILFKPSPTNPAELIRIRGELADMDLTRQQLAQQLDGRMKLLQSVEGEQFYLAIDTARRKMELRIGRNVVRDADVTIGPSKSITSSDGRTWTFLPLKGGFNVEGKQTDYAWTVPDWVYAMNGEPRPPEPRVVPNGLGKYVVHLPNGYVIESPPPPDSPLHGPKPGSYQVPEADLAAIWPRITNDTRVYIF